jgi:peptide/nickel transport system permease protein
MTQAPKALLIGAVISAAFLAMALLSLVWTPHSVTGVSIAERLQAPSATYVLGTDQFGRDMLSMLMIGAQTSIAVALSRWGSASVLACPWALPLPPTGGAF